MKKYAIIVLFMAFFATDACALDASANGKWISIGVPNYIHIGVDGSFYLQGNNQGSCQNVRPGYFRVDMDQPHFDEFYSWLLLMSAQKQPIDCVAASGCGTNDVWVKYCRGPL